MFNKKYWLNSNNWKVKGNNDFNKLKKITIKSVLHLYNNTLSHNSKFLIETINDIDILCCLLSFNHLNNFDLIYKLKKSNLFNKKSNCEYILSHNCLNSDIVNFILNKFPSFKSNQDLAIKILSNHTNSLPIYQYYSELLSIKNFTLSLFNNKKYNSYYSLISLPYDYDISKLLLLRNSYPSDKSETEGIFYNIEIFTESKLMYQCIKSSYAGPYLFSILPECMKNTYKLNKCMLIHHPNSQLFNSKFKTKDLFLKCFKYWQSINSFRLQFNSFKHLFNDDDILTILEFFKYQKISSSISPFPKLHPFNCFILENKNLKLINSFFNSSLYQDFLIYSKNNNNNFLLIDFWIKDNFYPFVEKYNCYTFLNTQKNIDKYKISKI